MFLDDQIVETILNEPDELNAGRKVLKLCCDNLHSDVDMERVCHLYNSACEKLNKMGKPILKKDGFHNLIERNYPDLKHLLPRSQA
jgi:hypothetical protein